ncbi:ABC transporter permease [Enterococcus dongliensis]|uniref:ABC transporter permease n=1 Tax=Enterococcus dongliensis TaxID=2559925 RepID=UPI00288D5A52|nr:ABC transporter permease [Enterococcus dongliensis]MDT2672804.1 ABC transporter permease [Enterococcus dongliensis]
MNRTIIIRAFVQQIRDKSTYIYFLLFPLALMLVLGSILQGAFGTSEIENKIDPIQIRYVATDQKKGAQFEAILQEVSTPKLVFKASSDEKQAINALKEKQADVYLSIGKNIDVEMNELSDIQFTLLKSYLVELFQTMHRLEGAQRFGQAPEEISDVSEKLDKALVVDQTNLKKPATSYQYYSVAMIALFILYMAENGLEMFGKSRRHKTLQREAISPVSRQTIINSTFLGHVLLGLCAVFVLMVITQTVFDVPWQQQFGFSFLNLSSLMILFLALGAFLETIGKEVGMGITQIIIQIAAFLGGGYFPVSEEMMNFSPMGWVMGPIREALWTNNALQWRGIILNLLFAVLMFLSMSIVLNRREEF